MSALLQLWEYELSGYNMFKSVSHNQQLMTCARSPDSSRVAVGGTGSQVFLYAVSPAQSPSLPPLSKCVHLLHCLKGHVHNVVSCKFSADGVLLFTASWDTRVIVWDVASGGAMQNLCHKIPVPQYVFATSQYSSYIRCLLFDSWANVLVTLSDGGRMKFWDMSDSAIEFEIGQQKAKSKAGACATMRCLHTEVILGEDESKALGTGTAPGAGGSRYLLMSSDRSYLLSGDATTLVVSKIHREVPSLMHSCRLVIRKKVFSSAKQMHYLPQQIKNYLCYKTGVPQHLS